MSVPLKTRISIREDNGRVAHEKEVVTFAGLLARAHEEGLCKISTELLQAPHDDNGNVAIVHACVQTERGEYDGLGDASPGNVNRAIAPHIIRMAETRAKARALRDAVNIGSIALEELADPTAGPASLAGGHSIREHNTGDLTPPSLSEPQHRLLRRLLARQGCPADQLDREICAAAGVQALQEVTRSTASKLIDEWK